MQPNLDMNAYKQLLNRFCKTTDTELLFVNESDYSFGVQHKNGYMQHIYLEELYDVMKTVRYIYKTNFNLTGNVKSIEEANDYLSSEDMTKYLKSRMTSNISNFIDHIEWRLTTEYSGYIELITTLKLEEDELQKISQWVSGQNADGLGESFEQQDFARYPTGLDEDDYGDELAMASFDWTTNDYIFEFVEEKEIE